MLFDYFLGQQFSKHGKQGKEVDEAVYDCICGYHWPGNVRELVNVCTYIAALSADEAGLITLENLPIVLLNSSAQAENGQSDAVAELPGNSQKSMIISKDSLTAAIENFGGHRESIANYFGISRMTLWRKMKKFGLDK